MSDAQALVTAPECYMINAGMGRFKGVSNRHQTTVAGPTVLQETLFKRLATMPQLPDKVSSLLVERPINAGDDPAFAAPSDRIAVIRGLIDCGGPASDSVEPSWQSLGRLLEDVTFVHAYNRLEFLRFNLAIPIDSFRETQRGARSSLSATTPTRL